MKNCVWVKWARLAIQFFWLGREDINNDVTRQARYLINSRDARHNFFDAAETIDQMIEFGYATTQRDAEWFLPPNMYPRDQDDRIIIERRNHYIREVYGATRRVNRRAQAELEQRVRNYIHLHLTTIPDEDIPSWDEATQREIESLYQHGAISHPLHWWETVVQRD